MQICRYAWGGGRLRDSLSINGFVTETIVFFYICLNLFLRYLWLALAFSAVRFSVHGINRSDIHLFLRFFSLNA